MIFQIMATARDMGITLEEFLQLSEDEKAIQFVYSSLLKKIDHVNEQDRLDQLEKQRSKRKKK